MLSILLINDNKIVSRLLQLSSKKSGFDIEESGIFSPQKDFYNLIFVDSDKYSDELLKNIKEKLTYDKLVFIGTAQVKKPEGFELVLEKPFLPTDFTALVEKNFIVDNPSDENNQTDEEELEEDIDSLLEEDTSFNIEDELENTSAKDLAQMVDEIDEIDQQKTNTSEDDKKDNENNEKLDETIENDEINIEDEELFEDENLENELGIDEELLEEDLENEKEEETPLPDIESELEENQEETTQEESDNLEEIVNDEEDKNNDTYKEEDELETIDKDDMKQFLEPTQTDNVDKITNKDDLEKETTTDEDLSTINNSDINKIIEEKLKEIITPDLIKSALKDMKITISFEDK